jgi:eukaryotic-like serine/threonine-protein kinase
MNLAVGSRIGPYEIVGAIGSGGMGEVYRAHDTNLGRDVAIKVLPEAFAQDPERIARFEREARTLAALNHPNIAGIYGLEKSQGTYALVMELVEGEDLSQRIARGPIPIDEALPVAKQIAEALKAAHEQGIIHRDLKPANIKVRRDGTVKVLDFGLAKLAEPAVAVGTTTSPLSLSPTITSPALMTGVGVLLGTAAYMSPEQAKGRPADKRSDIWAFGCVLYEMLTGVRAFDGESVAETLGAAIHKEPAWSLLPAGLPVPAAALLRRCLEKDCRKRVGEMAVALFALDESNSVNSIAPSSRVDGRIRRSLLLSIVATAGVVLALVFAVAAIWFLTRTAPAAVVRSQILTSGATALNVQGTDRDVAITPDGSRIVYRGTRQLLVRRMDRLEPDVLSGVGATDAPRSVFISPDGEWIGFFDENLLKKIAITGGPAVVIAKTDGAPRGATWGRDGSIVYATNAATTGLFRVSATGGEPVLVTKPDAKAGETDHVLPEFLPDGRTVLFTILQGSGLNTAEVAALDLSTGTYKVIVRGGHDAHYLPTGHLIYGASGTLRAVRFDLNRLQATGGAVPILEGVLTSSFGAINAAIADNGTLVYVPTNEGASEKRSLVWVTRDGREEPIPAPPRAYDSLRLSPDGTRAAIQSADQDNDVWVWDFGRRTLTRLTFAPELEYDPLWTPDGRRIIFQRGGTAYGLFSRAADGTGKEERLAATGYNTLPASFSPDGKQLVVTSYAESTPDIGLLTMDGHGTVTPLIHTMFTEQRADLSADGKWIAYQSNESGQFQIYVQPFPQLSDGRWQVSTTGGIDPVWSRAGRELFYLDGSGTLVTVPIHTQPTFSAGTATKLFDAPYFAVSGTRRYDVTADGQRFLFVKDTIGASGAAGTHSFVVVQHWFDELKRMAALTN